MLMGQPIVQEAVAENIQFVKVENEDEEFDKISNLEGTFSFSQDIVSPPDQVFSIFGTAVTGICAKPSFAMESSDEATYYINVGGDITRAYSVSLEELKDKEKTDTMLCACATGPAAANVEITGIPLQDVLALAEVHDDINTITIKGADGYEIAIPLRYALERNAMVVYRVNGEKVPSGTQLWVPGTVGRYFVRNVVDIKLTAEDKEPELKERDEIYRAQVAFMNYVQDVFKLGDEITFEGYADDCGSPIAAIEFSLDGGKNWDVHETLETTAEKWIYWNYSFVPQSAGNYQISVRARTLDDKVSPLYANVCFKVL